MLSGPGDLFGLYLDLIMSVISVSVSGELNGRFDWRVFSMSDGELSERSVSRSCSSDCFCFVVSWLERE